MSVRDCDVLIVGGGPTGVTLGLFLAAAGISTIIAEKERAIYPLPRGAHIDHEIVRILQNVGVAEAVMATSKTGGRYEFLTADRKILLSFDWTAPGASGWAPRPAAGASAWASAPRPAAAPPSGARACPSRRRVAWAPRSPPARRPALPQWSPRLQRLRRRRRRQ
jgi:choline dehydrogenase-like flavoprotein